MKVYDDSAHRREGETEGIAFASWKNGLRVPPRPPLQWAILKLAGRPSLPPTHPYDNPEYYIPLMREMVGGCDFAWDILRRKPPTPLAVM